MIEVETARYAVVGLYLLGALSHTLAMWYTYTRRPGSAATKTLQEMGATQRNVGLFFAALFWPILAAWVTPAVLKKVILSPVRIPLALIRAYNKHWYMKGAEDVIRAMTGGAGRVRRED